MGPHEVYTRPRQAASSRSDDCGIGWGCPPAQQPRQAWDLPHQGAFFFDSAEAAALADLWTRRNPAYVAQIVARAERIAAHRFPLLGYGDLDFGSPDPVAHRPGAWHALAARALVAYPVPRLPCGGRSQDRVGAEPGSFSGYAVCARLYTGEQRWLDEAIAQWRDWQKANPYPLGINWASTLEVAFRLLAWIWMDRLLGPRPPRNRSAAN